MALTTRNHLVSGQLVGNPEAGIDIIDKFRIARHPPRTLNYQRYLSMNTAHT